jgi:hypothetical protein
VSGADTNTLEALVAYAQEVLFGYEVTLAHAPLTAGERDTIQKFGAQAGGAADSFSHALARTGAKVPSPPDPNTAPPRVDNSTGGFLSDVITAEEAAVARYYTALQELQDERHIQGTAAFMKQAGQRLVVLRHMTRKPLLTRSFETGGA